MRIARPFFRKVYVGKNEWVFVGVVLWERLGWMSVGGF